MEIKDLGHIANTRCTKLAVTLPNGDMVPAHFHITEVGYNHRRFIDCGGTPRETTSWNMQLWVANDTEHRLTPQKFLGIVRKACADVWTFADMPMPIEIEYQAGDTISVYVLNGMHTLGDTVTLLLGNKTTNCLAPDKCGVPQEKLPPARKTACCGSGQCC